MLGPMRQGTGPRTPRRLGGVAGAVGVGLLVVALLLPGRPFQTSDTAVAMRAALVAHRRAFVVSTWVAALGAAGFIWFLGELRARLSLNAGGDGDARATVVALGGLGSWLLTLAGMAVFAGLALGGRDIGTSTVPAAVGTGNVLIELGKLPLAAALVALGVEAPRHGVISWVAARLALVVAVVLAVSALPPFLADRGIWQFGSGPDLAGAVPATVWLLWLAVHVARTTADQP